MNAPIEDQLRDYFTMVDRMQGPVDPTTQSQGTPTLSLVTEDSHDMNESTMEAIMISPDRNEPHNRSRAWMLIAASVAAVALVGGLIVAANRDSDDAPADQPTVTVPDTAGVDGETAPAPDAEQSDAQAPAPETAEPEASPDPVVEQTAPDPTTTSPPTTTTPLPFIERGTYAVPDEIAPGTYRVWGNAATRLDENMELIDIYLAAVPGYGIMIVQPTDAFVSVGDWIISVEDFGRPIDPIAENVIAGVYLVGYDLEPGRYEVLNGGHPEGTYWARLDDDLGIIDSEASDFGTVEVVVEASDFALEFKGTLRKIP